MRPGSAPMYVRRWPRISASSRTPPRDMRTNRRPSARANALAEAGLAHARSPTKQRIGSRAGLSPVTRGGSAGNWRHAWTGLARPAPALLPELLDGEVFENPVLDLLQVKVVLVQHLSGAPNVDGPATQLAPGQARHPVQIRETMPCSGEAGEMPASRLSSRSASRRASSGRRAASIRRRSSTT